MDKQWLKKLTRLKEPSQRDFVAHFREDLVRRDIAEVKQTIRFQLLQEKTRGKHSTSGQGNLLRFA